MPELRGAVYQVGLDVIGEFGADAKDDGEMAELVETALLMLWPDRAWFIEVGVDEEWVQIYQPWEAQ